MLSLIDLVVDIRENGRKGQSRDMSIHVEKGTLLLPLLAFCRNYRKHVKKAKSHAITTIRLK